MQRSRALPLMCLHLSASAKDPHRHQSLLSCFLLGSWSQTSLHGLSYQKSGLLATVAVWSFLMEELKTWTFTVAPRANEGRAILITKVWTKVLLATTDSSVFVSVGSKADLANGTGFPLFANTYVELTLMPGTSLYVGGPNGSQVACVAQPLTKTLKTPKPAPIRRTRV